MKMNYPKIAEHLGVKLRGDETFDELLKIEQQVKEKRKVEPDLKEFKKRLKAYIIEKADESELKNFDWSEWDIV